MSDAAVPQPGIPPPAAAPFLTSRARPRLRFWAGLLLFFALALAASFAAYRYRQSQPAAILPSAPARQGDFLVLIRPRRARTRSPRPPTPPPPPAAGADFLVLIRCRGELAAERSVQIYAPMVPNLRIAWMTPPGEGVKQADTIVDRKFLV